MWLAKPLPFEDVNTTKAICCLSLQIHLELCPEPPDDLKILMFACVEKQGPSICILVIHRSTTVHQVLDEFDVFAPNKAQDDTIFAIMGSSVERGPFFQEEVDGVDIVAAARMQQRCPPLLICALHLGIGFNQGNTELFGVAGSRCCHHQRRQTSQGPAIHISRSQGGSELCTVAMPHGPHQLRRFVWMSCMHGLRDLSLCTPQRTMMLHSSVEVPHMLPQEAIGIAKLVTLHSRTVQQRTFGSILLRFSLD